MDPAAKAKKQEAVIWEARSRIVWGEPPKEILEFMLSEGIDEQHAHDLIAIAQQERSQHIRQRGVKETAIGSGILLLGGLGVALIVFSRTVGSKELAGIVILIAYGLFRFCRGLGWIFSGSNMRGSVTDMDDQVL